jgi:hypothetical protein
MSISKLCHVSLFRCRRIRASLSRLWLGLNHCNILRANRLRQSILKKAFEGELAGLACQARATCQARSVEGA